MATPWEVTAAVYTSQAGSQVRGRAGIPTPLLGWDDLTVPSPSPPWPPLLAGVEKAALQGWAGGCATLGGLRNKDR